MTFIERQPHAIGFVWIVPGIGQRIYRIAPPLAPADTIRASSACCCFFVRLACLRFAATDSNSSYHHRSFRDCSVHRSA